MNWERVALTHRQSLQPVFEVRRFPAGEWADGREAGWYWWLPAEPKVGPFKTESLAAEDAIATTTHDLKRGAA